MEDTSIQVIQLSSYSLLLLLGVHIVGSELKVNGSLAYWRCLCFSTRIIIYWLNRQPNWDVCEALRGVWAGGGDRGRGAGRGRWSGR